MKISQNVLDEAMQKMTEMFGSIEVYAEYKLLYYDKKYYSLKNFKDSNAKWGFISNIMKCKKKLVFVDIELIDKLYLIYSQTQINLLQKELLLNINDIKNKLEKKQNKKQILKNIKELKNKLVIID